MLLAPALLLPLGLASTAHALDVGDVVVTEFMADPVVPAYYGQWIELYNASGRNLDLQGLQLLGVAGEDAGFTIDVSLVVPAGDWVVLAPSDVTTNNGGVTVDFVYDFSDFELRKASDTIRVVDSGTVIDQVTWSNGAGWGVGSETAHQVNAAGATGSTPVDHPILSLEWANNLPQNWCQAETLRSVPGGTGQWYGTPGAMNVICDGSGVDDDGDGFTEAMGDCDDEDPTVNPDAIDGIEDPYGVANDDADCDGDRDDGVTDDDGDGYSEVDGDCDDEAPGVNPAERDTPDGRDNDCNGCVDDLDNDNDGWTECTTGEVVDCDDEDTITCTSQNFDPEEGVYPSGYVEGACAMAFDCDNGDNLVYPCAVDTWYDGVDQSCDAYDACDRDGDGYDSEDCPGTPDRGAHQFDSEGNANAADCDDQDASVHPGASEGDPENGGQANGKDDDCNGVVDDPYADLDGDGYTIAEGDCYDVADDPLSATVFPGAQETCGDGLDNDCDGFFDDGCSDPLGYATARGGGLCGVADGPAAPLAGFALAALALAAAATRRRED
jgi:hypothetical protein